MKVYLRAILYSYIFGLILAGAIVLIGDTAMVQNGSYLLVYPLIISPIFYF